MNDRPADPTGATAAAPAADPARQAYRGAALRWNQDASVAYVPMARHLVQRSPVELDGALVLDAGAGTGAASTVLVDAGAHVVAVDLEPTMIAFARSSRPPAVVADVGQLPLRRGSFDVVVAAFVLNHVVQVAATIQELRRVTKTGGAVLASTFSNRRATAKTTFDDVAARHGWRPPVWYQEIRDRQSGIGAPDLLAAAAREGGLSDPVVTEQSLDIQVDEPSAIVRYRLGMPQYAEWAERLADDHRLHRFIAEATATVAADGPFRPDVIELVAVVT